MPKNTLKKYGKTMRGGMFNQKEKQKLTRTLKKIWKKTNESLEKEELHEVMKELNAGSQLFSGSKLKQLRDQIEPFNKAQFNIWLHEIYPLFVEDVETDFESMDSSHHSTTTSI